VVLRAVLNFIDYDLYEFIDFQSDYNIIHNKVFDIISRVIIKLVKFCHVEVFRGMQSLLSRFHRLWIDGW